ncbi:MAG: hypothetical protein VW270_13585 [Candidatus Poseidoniales archaeon]
MPATITDEFKRFLIDDVYNDFINAGLDSSDPNLSQYYIAIGRTQPWEEPDSDTNPPTPTPSMLEELNFRENIQSLKRCTDASHVTLRYNWTNGNIYSGWNNKYHSNNIFLAGQPYEDPFYVITNNNQVYVCVKQGHDGNGLPANSTIQPSNNSGEVFETSDGYQWKYMFTVGTTDTQKYLTSGYIPCETVLDSTEGGPSIDDLDAFKQEQLILQGEAIPGQILGVDVEEGGSNFVDGVYPLEFDGIPLSGTTITDAYAWATAVGGSIVDVSMRDPNAIDTYYFGKNYYNATVNFIGGSPGDGVKLRPIISQKTGLGARPDLDLNSTALMFNVILEGDGGGDFIIDNDFRQVGLVRNILAEDSDGSGNISLDILNTDTSLALSSVEYNPADVGATLDLDNITGDNLMTGQTSGAVAIINAVRDGRFYYTQDKTTGYRSFTNEPVDISDGGGSTSITNPTLTNVDKTSGQVFYIDYRRPFMRSLDQTEDIKIVIDF